MAPELNGHILIVSSITDFDTYRVFPLIGVYIVMGLLQSQVDHIKVPDG